MHDVPPTVRRLGWVSFFTDAAAEMVYPLLPALLRSFGMASVWLGAMEGVAEALSALVKWRMGGPTDRAGHKKPFVVAGYALANFVRPFLSLATTGWHVLLVRSLDRIGKGVRTVPRDAMLAAAVDERSYATGFAFHRAMDNAGSVLGPILGFVALRALDVPIRGVMALAIVPGAVSLAILVFGVRERRAAPHGVAGAGVERRSHERGSVDDAGARGDTERGDTEHGDTEHGDAEKAPASEPRSTSNEIAAETVAWPSEISRYLAIVTLFTLGASADSFLLLRALELGLPEERAPLLWLALSASKTLSNLPGGWLADRIGRRTTLAFAWLVYAAVYVMIPFVERLGILAVVIVAYGAYYGLGEGAERAIVAEYAPAPIRGRAFARLYALTGLAVLPANLGFGALYKIRPVFAFTAGGLCAFVAAILLLALLPRRPTSSDILRAPSSPA